MKKAKAIILAAGQGTRMKSKKPKVIHEICGEPLIHYVIDACRKAGIHEIAVVVGYGGDQVEKLLPEDVSVFWQKEQLGTGHAVMQALPFLEKKDGEEENDDVFVLMGDAPLISPETLEMMGKIQEQGNFSATVLTAEYDDPTGYGRIITKSDELLRIVEHKDATPAEQQICEINSGMYCFKAKALTAALENLTTDNVQHEYYLTDTIDIIRAGGQRVGTCKTENIEDIAAVNSKVQLAEAAAIMQKRINRRLMDEGAILIDPARSYLSAATKIGIDSVIYPGVMTQGTVVIGENCTIGADTRIEDSIIGDDVVIHNSTILQSTIGDETKVGPYAYIRPGSEIGRNVKVGDFVEVKNAVMKDGAKASHLTYIGDADVGENVNLGCGTVFVNYDGINKYRTVVEDECFIGCNTNLISPVTVEKGSYIAAGSTITDDVPPESLAIARAKQVNKPGYAATLFRKKNRGEKK